MEDKIKMRFMMFLLGCIPLRFALVYFAANSNELSLKIMGIMSCILSLGFMFLYLTGIRTVGIETLGDKIWWNNLRPFHSILYLIFGILSLNNVKKAYYLLLVDVIIGLLSFLLYHNII